MLFRTPAEPPEPAPPDLDEGEALAAVLANGLLVMREGLTPAFDAADGMRADLLARGWSAQAAEVLTMTWLQQIVVNCTPIIGIGDLE
ncbi:hypothetical protein ACFVJK_30770 [Streptomyces sp. NPDC127172]|uniref:hypothetical protein n=1 Tax=Streptomyces sp. NPDC127172 TaxID=3345382 RepID=UPI0036354382